MGKYKANRAQKRSVTRKLSVPLSSITRRAFRRRARRSRFLGSGKNPHDPPIPDQASGKFPALHELRSCDHPGSGRLCHLFRTSIDRVRWVYLQERCLHRCFGLYLRLIRIVVPRNGPGMDKRHNVVEPNQACTLHYSQPGSGTVSGADYIKVGYLLDVNDLRRNFLVVLG